VDRRGYKKRSARIAVRYQAVLTEADGCRVDVLVTEVSGSGFRLESDAKLEPGDEVFLHVGKRRPVRARIQWTRGREAGGAFVEPAEI
jgi:hypothetical protein